jgi:Na+/H+ antiporter NhaD/arsenite permease-like protein
LIGNALGSLFSKGVSQIFGSVVGGGITAVGTLANIATG